MNAPVDVINNAADKRFEISESGKIASLTYTMRSGKLYLIHTEVPEALEGRGYGSALARTALEYAKREHLRVIPLCPFASSYLERHPEYASLTEHQ
jgi:uncharacterized protein